MEQNTVEFNLWKEFEQIQAHKRLFYVLPCSKSQFQYSWRRYVKDFLELVSSFMKVRKNLFLSLAWQTKR